MTVTDLPSLKLVVDLGGAGHPVDLVGGKAASLDALVRHGFPVPPAIALTKEAYIQFIEAAGLEDYLSEIEHRPHPLPDALEDEWDEIQDAFLTAEMDGHLRAALLEGLDQVSRKGPVAVRSSATTEDLGNASFAGQHLSVLEVVGPEEVERAVRRVWASLWHPASRAYRSTMKIDTDGLAMPVIVQRLVPAERSGVCFTADPSAPGLVRVEAIEGLGEALVSGQTTPDVYRLSRPGLHAVDDSATPPVIRSVARMALEIGQAFGVPQDVEWSAVGGRVWILQARPITTLSEGPGDGFDAPMRPDDQYTPTGVAEMLPGVLSPLLWTINGPMVEEAFRKLLDGLGALPARLAGPHALLARVGGRAALNLSIVRDASRAATGDSGAEVERQYLGHTLSDDAATSGQGRRLRTLVAAVRGMRLRKRAEEDGEVFERTVGAVLKLRTDLRDLTNHELLAYRARIRDLAASGVTAEVAIAAAAAASYRSLEATLEGWVGAAGPEWAQRVTKTSAGSAIDPIGETLRVWREFGSPPEALDCLEGGASGLRRATPDGEEFEARLFDVLDHLGSSNVYGGPTWAEHPEYLGALLRARAGHEPKPVDGKPAAHDELRTLEKTLTHPWRWRATRMLTGQIIDVRVRLLRGLAAEARRLLDRRETIKAAVLRLGGEERRVLRVVAERLAARGAISSATEIDLFADWEVDEVLLGRAPAATMELAARQRALDSYNKAQPLPVLVNADAGELVTAGSGEELRGWAASPGVYRGRVRIVTNLESARDLQPGEVLVARATDPSWTPLFLTAGAIVVERGGPLSHAAIVSRELGVPAVLNVAGATDILKPGALVEVDGTTGTIILIDEEAA